jgi:tight adherence protein B
LLTVTVHLLRRHRATRLVAGRRAATVDVVHALAAELRAGRPLAAALAAVVDQAGALRAELIAAAAAVRTGARAAEELDRLAGLPGCHGLRGASAAWDVTERAGGPVADLLDRLGAALDVEQRQRQVLDVAMAGPRTTVALLAVLPLMGVALGQSVGARPLDLLLHRPFGWGLLAAAAALDGAGVLWVRRLTRVEEP